MGSLEGRRGLGGVKTKENEGKEAFLYHSHGRLVYTRLQRRFESSFSISNDLAFDALYPATRDSRWR